MEYHVIVWGNPLDGTEIIGPFPSSAAANEYAERYLDGDWWVTELYPPCLEWRTSP